jgi:osmoprotectant transport system ATP-binding protein
VDRTPPSATAATITLDGVGKKYEGGTVAVGSLSLEIPAGDLVVLIGPSGCGKSTVLRMLNRLIEPTNGRILLDGDDILAQNPVELRRRIGYVIQQVGLFPHQTIAANIATVPKLLGWSKADVRNRVNELMELVGLEAKRYADRYPHELSGGQRQRIGVARALAADPVVLLMDEPFSAVDPIVRLRLQDEFLRLQRTVRKTIVFVTHDIDEAVRLADRVAVLSEGGVLEQYGEPADILRAPANEFVREFVGSDRGIKELSVTPIDLKRLSSIGAVDIESEPRVRSDATLRDALAALLVGGVGRVAVTDADGKPIGVLTAADIARVVADSANEAAAPR